MTHAIEVTNLRQTGQPQGHSWKGGEVMTHAIEVTNLRQLDSPKGTAGKAAK